MMAEFRFHRDEKSNKNLHQVMGIKDPEKEKQNTDTMSLRDLFDLSKEKNDLVPKAKQMDYQHESEALLLRPRFADPEDGEEESVGEAIEDAAEEEDESEQATEEEIANAEEAEVESELAQMEPEAEGRYEEEPTGAGSAPPEMGSIAEASVQPSEISRQEVPVEVQQQPPAPETMQEVRELPPDAQRRSRYNDPSNFGGYARLQNNMDAGMATMPEGYGMAATQKPQAFHPHKVSRQYSGEAGSVYNPQDVSVLPPGQAPPIMEELIDHQRAQAIQQSREDKEKAEELQPPKNIAANDWNKLNPSEQIRYNELIEQFHQASANNDPQGIQMASRELEEIQAKMRDASNPHQVAQMNNAHMREGQSHMAPRGLDKSMRLSSDGQSSPSNMTDEQWAALTQEQQEYYDDLAQKLEQAISVGNYEEITTHASELSNIQKQIKEMTAPVKEEPEAQADVIVQGAEDVDVEKSLTVWMENNLLKAVSWVGDELVPHGVNKDWQTLEKGKYIRSAFLDPKNKEQVFGEEKAVYKEEHIHVPGHTREDGSYVKPHTRKVKKRVDPKGNYQYSYTNYEADAHGLGESAVGAYTSAATRYKIERNKQKNLTIEEKMKLEAVGALDHTIPVHPDIDTEAMDPYEAYMETIKRWRKDDPNKIRWKKERDDGKWAVYEMRASREKPVAMILVDEDPGDDLSGFKFKKKEHSLSLSNYHKKVRAQEIGAESNSKLIQDFKGPNDEPVAQLYHNPANALAYTVIDHTSFDDEGNPCKRYYHSEKAARANMEVRVAWYMINTSGQPQKVYKGATPSADKDRRPLMHKLESGDFAYTAVSYTDPISDLGDGIALVPIMSEAEARALVAELGPLIGRAINDVRRRMPKFDFMLSGKGGYKDDIIAACVEDAWKQACVKRNALGGLSGGFQPGKTAENNFAKLVFTSFKSDNGPIVNFFRRTGMLDKMSNAEESKEQEIFAEVFGLMSEKEWKQNRLDKWMSDQIENFTIKQLPLMEKSDHARATKMLRKELKGIKSRRHAQQFAKKYEWASSPIQRELVRGSLPAPSKPEDALTGLMKKEGRSGVKEGEKSPVFNKDWQKQKDSSDKDYNPSDRFRKPDFSYAIQDETGDERGDIFNVDFSVIGGDVAQDDSEKRFYSKFNDVFDNITDQTSRKEGLLREAADIWPDDTGSELEARVTKLIRRLGHHDTVRAEHRYRGERVDSPHLRVDNKLNSVVEEISKNPTEKEFYSLLAKQLVNPGVKSSHRKLDIEMFMKQKFPDLSERERQNKANGWMRKFSDNHRAQAIMSSMLKSLMAMLVHAYGEDMAKSLDSFQVAEKELQRLQKKQRIEQALRLHYGVSSARYHLFSDLLYLSSFSPIPKGTLVNTIEKHRESVAKECGVSPSTWSAKTFRNKVGSWFKALEKAAEKK